MQVLSPVLLVFVAIAAVGNTSLIKEEVSRIVGGLPANDVDIPYIVSLIVFGFHTCGGSIINERTVVTAAHCLSSMRPRLLRVHAGSKTRSLQEGVVIPVSAIHIHDKYNERTVDYDIGLVRLATPLTYSPTIQPITLAKSPATPNLPEGTYATVAGWGYTNSGGSSSEILRYARVPIVAREKCNQQLQGGVTQRMICAGFPRGGIDACQMDSGGPLVVQQTLVGVVSWGKGCALPNKPGVYALVSELLPWVQQKLISTYSEQL